MTEPLAGIKVVELGRALQGPVAGQYLADMGADVIKVEPALGDPNRQVRGHHRGRPAGGFGTQFVSANRGKRSLWLDLRRDSSLEIVRRLTDEADVFLSNYLEPSLIAMGLGYDALRARNQELIYALVNGYGPLGPDAAKPMLDGSAAARGGLYSVTGPADGGPMMPGSTIADTAGAMQLALAITTAIAARALHGGGQRVDVSALGAQLWLQMWEIDTVSLTGRTLGRDGAHSANIPGTYGIYETADGAVMIAFLRGEQTWVSFCHFASLDELIADPRFETAEKRSGRAAGSSEESANEIRPYLERAFKAKTTAEWATFLATLPDLVWDVVQGYDEVLRDQQAHANDYFVLQEIPTYGKRQLLGNVIRFNGERPPVKPLPPSLGEHNQEILSSLGYTADEIELVQRAALDAMEDRLGFRSAR
jgi:crotonobetainyl-CoA:carnitine CoA-transferase CaiB-like acyl-CoA transferase